MFQNTMTAIHIVRRTPVGHAPAGHFVMPMNVWKSIRKNKDFLG